MKVIYKHENMMVLHSVKNILEMNDIECYLKNEYGHTMGPEFGLSNVQLELWLANENDYDKATKIIEQQMNTPTTEDTWQCSSCNEENESNFGMCWKCQNVKLAS